MTSEKVVCRCPSNESLVMKRRYTTFLAAGLGALIVLSFAGCATPQYQDYMETHDPAPQQNANERLQDHQQMNADIQSGDRFVKE